MYTLLKLRPLIFCQYFIFKFYIQHTHLIQLISGLVIKCFWYIKQLLLTVSFPYSGNKKVFRVSTVLVCISQIKGISNIQIFFPAVFQGCFRDHQFIFLFRIVASYPLSGRLHHDTPIRLITPDQSGMKCIVCVCFHCGACICSCSCNSDILIIFALFQLLLWITAVQDCIKICAV